MADGSSLDGNRSQAESTTDASTRQPPRLPFWDVRLRAETIDSRCCRGGPLSETAAGPGIAPGRTVVWKGVHLLGGQTEITATITTVTEKQPDDLTGGRQRVVPWPFPSTSGPVDSVPHSF